MKSKKNPGVECTQIAEPLQSKNSLSSLELASDRFSELDKLCRVNLRKAAKEPPYSLLIDGIGVLPKGDIWCIQAKPKMGKTQAATILMAGVLGCEKFGMTVPASCGKHRVVYFDTEQAEHNTLIVGHRVHRLMGWPIEANNRRFRAYNLREQDTSDKLAIIYNVIATYKPTFVIIDGIADLLDSINDEAASSQIVQKLMQMSTKFKNSIGTIIHENKSADNHDARGHLGTMLYLKVCDCFAIDKKGDIYTLEHNKTRNLEIKEKVQWVINDAGEFERYDKDNQTITDEVREEKRKVWKAVFDVLEKSIAGYRELCRAYQSTHSCSEKTAKRHISEAIGQDVIKKTENGYIL